MEKVKNMFLNNIGKFAAVLLLNMCMITFASSPNQKTQSNLLHSSFKDVEKDLKDGIALVLNIKSANAAQENAKLWNQVMRKFQDAYIRADIAKYADLPKLFNEIKESMQKILDAIKSEFREKNNSGNSNLLREMLEDWDAYILGLKYASLLESSIEDMASIPVFHVKQQENENSMPIEYFQSLVKDEVDFPVQSFHLTSLATVAEEKEQKEDNEGTTVELATQTEVTENASTIIAPSNNLPSKTNTDKTNGDRKIKQERKPVQNQNTILSIHDIKQRDELVHVEFEAFNNDHSKILKFAEDCISFARQLINSKFSKHDLLNVRLSVRINNMILKFETVKRKVSDQSQISMKLKQMSLKRLYDDVKNLINDINQISKVEKPVQVAATAHKEVSTQKNNMTLILQQIKSSISLASRLINNELSYHEKLKFNLANRIQEITIKMIKIIRKTNKISEDLMQPLLKRLFIDVQKLVVDVKDIIRKCKKSN